jgi:myo-inositol 2-dehydrogenase / D-chiro-inositol 1-dehydrogenase
MTNKNVGICVIGAGRAGMIHARNFANVVKGSRIVAVVDAVEKVAKDAAKELNVEKYYTDYKMILDDDSIDAVVIVSPTDLHKQIVIDCAKAKKHIFCEKPMAMNVKECEEMVKVCKANNVKFQIGFMRRHDESFVDAKEKIDSGIIGDIVSIKSCTRGPSKPRPWMYDLKKSNGILAEVNSHDIDCIRWLIGSEIKTIYAIAGNYRNKEVSEQYPDYYDSVMMSGMFQNGVKYCIDGAAFVQYGYDARVEVVGTKGVIHIGRNEKNFIQCITPEHGQQKEFITSWTKLFKDAYLEEEMHFVDCIINDKEPKVTGFDGLMAVKIVELGNKSISTGQIVEV